MGHEFFMLSDAAKLGLSIIVRCNHCAVRRFYVPDDLIQVVGNITLGQIEAKMRCSKCGSNDYLRVKSDRPSAAEMQKAKFRRLKEIKWVRRPVWVDDP